MKQYIHSYERDLARRLAWLESTLEMSKENKELIQKFYTYNKLNGLSVPRLIKHFDTLKLTSMHVILVSMMIELEKKLQEKN